MNAWGFDNQHSDLHLVWPTYRKNDREGCHPDKNVSNLILVEPYTDLPWDNVVNFRVPEIVNEPEPAASDDQSGMEQVHKPE